MKKIQLNTAKLQLNKEKISNLTHSTLTNNEMQQVNGGHSVAPPPPPPPQSLTVLPTYWSRIAG